MTTAAAALLVLAGCGDDSDCPSIAGTWTIVSHCEPSLVNETVTVTQSGCGILYAEPFSGWSGTISSEGVVTATGPAGPDQITCTGTVTGSSWSLTCTPPCSVTLQRQ
jgi:hypothetical protein